MSNILKGLNEGRSYGRDSWDSNMPGYQGDYGGAANWGRRNREDDEHHEIDAVLAARHAQRQEYERNGKFWLKLKDSQRHLPAGPFTGKQAANIAAVELLKQQPELKGNLLITAYGPDETQGVAEATGNTGLPHDFTAVQPGAEVWYKGRFAGWTTGKVYDDPYGKAGKMVAFEPNPSEFPGDDGRILSLPYDEVSLRKSTSIGKLKGPGQGVAEGSEEQVYKVVALDKSNALKKPTKLNVKASSIEDVFSRLAANDWYALSINGVEVVAGKRLKQGVAEGPGFDKWADERAASQLYKLNAPKTWEVSYDYGPHMTKTVTVKARSEDEARAKVEKAAEKKGMSIMINSVEQQGVAEGLSKRDQQDVAAIRAAIARLESQLNHPNADKAAIQQSIAHEKKRLALYGQGVAEDQLDELSNKTLASYKKKAGADASQADKRGDYARGDKRMSGIIKATKKEFDNDAKGIEEEKQRLDPSCWKGYKKQGTKMKGDTRVNNCVPVKESAIMKGLK